MRSDTLIKNDWLLLVAHRYIFAQVFKSRIYSIFFEQMTLTNFFTFYTSENEYNASKNEKGFEIRIQCRGKEGMVLSVNNCNKSTQLC